MTGRATDVYRALQRQARVSGRNTQQVMELYVHERLLARVAASRFADRLTLKGGMLLAALAIRDVTRDADLLARAIDMQPENVEAVVAEIASIDLHDGLEFDRAAIASVTMREDDSYQGLRVRLPVMLGTARLVAQLDINFGDPIVGEPMEVGGAFVNHVELAQPFTINAYRIEDVVAEKVATMIQRGDLNTRERDFGDVWLISRLMHIGGDHLMSALEVTVRHRRHERTRLSERLFTIGVDRRAAWGRYRDMLGNLALPEAYVDVVADVIAFADPVILGSVAGRSWSPDQVRWT